MRWPRFTVRRAMLGVLIVAVVLGLTLPVVEVLGDKKMHVHSWINPDGQPRSSIGGPIRLAASPPSILGVEIRSSPFWPRFRRCLLGRPWRDQPLCAADPSRIVEACELQHPEIVDRQANGSFFVHWTPEILSEGRKRHPDLFPANSPDPSPLAGP